MSNESAGSVITVEFACQGASGNAAWQKIRIPITPNTSVKEATLEAVKRLSKLRACTASEIRVAEVLVDGASLFGSDPVMSVVDVRKEAMRVVLAEPLVIAHRDMFVIQQRPAHSERSTDLLSAPLAGARDPPQPASCARRPEPKLVEAPPNAPPARETSIDVSSGQSATQESNGRGGRQRAAHATHTTEREKGHRVRKCLPAGRGDPARVPLSTAIEPKSNVAGGTKARNARRREEEEEDRAKQQREAADSDSRAKRSADVASKAVPDEQLSSSHPAPAPAESTAVLRPPLGRELGWGSRAAEYFDPSYVSDPDAFARERRKQRRLELDSRNQKTSGSESVKLGEASRAAPPPATTTADSFDETIAATAAKQLPPKDELEGRTAARVLFALDSDSPPEGKTPRGSNRRKELGWGTEAAEHFSPLYTSDPARLSPRTSKALSELPRELRHRTLPPAV